MKPRISVIIPTYNDSKDIVKCLNSLKNQTLKWGEDFEVIISDGRSKDGTDEIARKMGAKVVYEDIGTRGGACNVGAQYASSDIIVFTDADAYFPPDWLEKILKKFEETGADVVGGDDILGDDANTFERLVFLFDLYKGQPKTERDVVNRLRGVNTAYRKNVFDVVGGFDPQLASVEETEMHWRMYSRGFKLVYDPDIFVYHHRRRDIKGLIKQMIRNGIGRIAAIKRNIKILSAMDIIPFVSIGVFLAMSLLSIIIRSVTPVGVFVVVSLLYIITKPLMVIGLKNIRHYPKILIINFVREFFFLIGLIKGIFSSKKPDKKM